MRLLRILLLERRNGKVVNWFMFFCPRDDLDLVAPFVVADIDGSFLDVEYPEGQDAVENGVEGYGERCVEFRVVETELEIPVEGRGADCECGVA